MQPRVRLRASAKFLVLALAVPLSAPFLGCGSSDGGTSTQTSSGDGGHGAHAGTGGNAGGSGGSGGSPVNSGLTVTPGSATVAENGSVAFKASASAVWTLKEGAAAGTIDKSGVYTAPAKPGTFHVIATGTADSTKRGEATVKVVPPGATNPNLVQGKWVNLTPPGLDLVCCPPTGNSFGIAFVTIDPSNPTTLYAAVDQLGLWKTSDDAQSWKRLGDPHGAITNTDTTYLDGPIRVAVDPDDPQHLYATQGVRGTTLGFWVSHDGGDTWKKPQGFIDIAATIGTQDMTSMSIDPSDFKHFILGSHSAWMGLTNAGILESSDGGNTFRKTDPKPSWGSGSMGVNILSDPSQNVGDGKTWLVGTDGNGFWRTTDAGDTWTQVAQNNVPHGGQDIYYSQTGWLYAGAAQYPVRSHDNGKTWEQITMGLSYWYYYTVQGDGKRLYTQLSFTGDNGGQGMKPYMTSLESDGTTWTQFDDQMFSDGPFTMRFDPINKIMYSANWDAGIWALKVEP